MNTYLGIEVAFLVALENIYCSKPKSLRKLAFKFLINYCRTRFAAERSGPFYIHSLFFVILIALALSKTQSCYFFYSLRNSCYFSISLNVLGFLFYCFHHFLSQYSIFWGEKDLLFSFYQQYFSLH